MITQAVLPLLGQKKGIGLDTEGKRAEATCAVIPIDISLIEHHDVKNAKRDAFAFKDQALTPFSL